MPLAPVFSSFLIHQEGAVAAGDQPEVRLPAWHVRLQLFSHLCHALPPTRPRTRCDVGPQSFSRLESVVELRLGKKGMASVNLLLTAPLVQWFGVHSRSWVQWIQWPPTGMHIRHGEPADLVLYS